MIAPWHPLWHSVGEHELPEDLCWLTSAERERAEGMVFTKRRTDYLLGRLAGKRTLAEALRLDGAAPELRRIEIRNRQAGPERGAPEPYLDEEPAPFDLSISDRAGWGVCALAPPGVRIGCDLELVEPRSDAFVADYLTERERAFVAAAPNPQGRWARANLVWCAKESALKLLRCGLRRDTRSVEVRVLASPPRDGWRELRIAAVEGRVFHGWWSRFGPFLLTLAAESQTLPPRALVDPPGLRGARPSHAWLEAPTVGRGPASGASA